MPIYTRSQRIASLRGRAAATASSRSSTNAESWQRNTGLAHAWALVQETNTVGTEQITAPPTNPTSVAAAAPLTQSKRTRSQRTTAATADTSIATKPSTAVVAAVVSTNTKKARFSKSEPQQQPRTYKLRSSAALADSPDDDIASATAVTPGTVTRQINFETNAADDDDTESVFSDSSADILPMGVVNIFAKWDKAAGCVAKSKAVSGCSCCHTNHQETLQILASQHLSEYGSEYCQEMQTKEARELQILQRIEPLLPPQPLLLDATSAETRLQQQRRRFNSAAALDEDSDSTVDATAAATQTRRRRSLALESRKSDNHARETASATTSTEAAISMTVNRLNETEPLPNQPLLTAKMRRVLVQWMSEVGQEYKLSEATYHLAVTLLDIVLTLGPTRQEFFETQVVPPQQQHVIVGYGCGDDDDPAQSNKLLIQRNDFQALGCACIWIASKMEDMTPPRSEDLVYISDFSFTPDKLRSLETRICKVLQFRLHRVTPFHFVHVNLRASQACAAPNCHHFLGRASAMQQMTLYLLEISRSCYLLSHRKPSLIAAACVYLARATLGVGEKVLQHGSKGGDGNNSHGSVSVYWTKTLEYYTGYTVNDLKDTVLKIHRLQISAEKSSNGVAPAFSKYKTEANLRVSLRTVRRVEELGFFGTTEMMTMIKHDDMIVDDENAVVL